MKPHLLKVATKPEASFNILKKEGIHFYNQWHFHPEIELIFINYGRGTRFIGNDVHRFETGELFLLGSNLAHMWRCDPEYLKENSTSKAEVTIIYFHHDFLGKDFFKTPELKKIALLLEKAKQGLQITGKSRILIHKLINTLLKSEDLDKVLTMLTILKNIAESKEKQVIDPLYHQLNFDKEQAHRLNEIFQYTSNNFKRKITLAEVASIANLSQKSFCRYFKAKTQKTYYHYLLEVRVAHACNLLLEKEMTIYEVCYECGFNNLSNFNRYFKIIMGKPPQQFKKEHKLLIN